ncbi:MAG: [FeFe] hydrogenase H-cluster radical SAM maturase HydE [Candidatus Cloacimonadota bacterium]|nr:MAG: [FeFe] hydrogenase H-cluster radical SAM maturase HydE [Candidatus Cloacimonadota bacterium]
MNWDNLSEKEIISLLKTEDENLITEMYKQAYKTKTANVGNKVYYRGIIEFSNICEKDCYYCGIRKSNSNVKRFMMSEDEIVESAEWAWKQNYGSMVIQSGERRDEAFVSLIERVLKKIKKMSNNELGITISLGEQSRETYQRWYDAGAHRYLLRIESSNPAIYQSLHPKDHDFNERFSCIEYLREIGYQVGTGVMIGLPGQTAEDLAKDILFFKNNDVDMIGMGPYVVHNETPLAKKVKNFDKEKQLTMGLKMIALTRLVLKDVNIAATTALQALNPTGREFGLQAGANIVMPVITGLKYRKQYLLYDNKPCVDENASECRNYLQKSIESVKEEVGYGEWGDSPHFRKKKSGGKNG